MSQANESDLEKTELLPLDETMLEDYIEVLYHRLFPENPDPSLRERYKIADQSHHNEPNRGGHDLLPFDMYLI